MKKNKFFGVAIFCGLLLAFSATSCTEQTSIDKPITIPTVTTVEVTEVTETSAMCSGTIESNGGADILSKGIIWDIEPNLTTDLPTKTSEGMGDEPFTSMIENLEGGTTYYYRAYAINSAGTAYGEELSFTTKRPSVIQVKVGEHTLDFVYVEGGTFQMGATPEQEPFMQNYETPVHSVTLDSYYIGKYEITQDVWTSVMGYNPSIFKGNNKSVENLNWNMANDFVQKLNQMGNHKFALPTEAQWEYAARGGNKTNNYIYAGGNDPAQIGWFMGMVTGTSEVGKKQPNELGIYDMCGNVWEWCQDWFSEYTADAQTNPTGPANGTDKVMRGGSWIVVAKEMGRVSKRLIDYPQVQRMDNGVRLVYIP